MQGTARPESEGRQSPHFLQRGAELLCGHSLPKLGNPTYVVGKPASSDFAARSFTLDFQQLESGCAGAGQGQGYRGCKRVALLRQETSNL